VSNLNKTTDKTSDFSDDVSSFAYCIIAEIKVVVAKASFNLKTFHQQNELKFKEETNEVPHLGHGAVWRLNLDTWEGGSKMPGRS